ncbi:AAA family ATPase [Rhodococcus sp. NPDC060176]|uniref:AAA family ATPase n=1 Tax=Rhodococcus sp. NPDC060176 TaxID=3347062 RepID=UPI003650215A
MTDTYEPAWFQALDNRQQRRALRWMRGEVERPTFLPEDVQGPVPRKATKSQGPEHASRVTVQSSPVTESVDDFVARLVNQKGADKLAAARTAAEKKVGASFRSRADLRAMPALEPLVDGFLYLDTVARLIGPPGCYKSFLALDWAASVVTGTPWHGQGVTQGGVVYLVGEGVRGIDARLTAWERHRYEGNPAEVEVFDGIVDLAAPQTDAAEWVALARMLQRRNPSLIVIDTQARYTPGHEENSSTEMGILVNNLDALRRITGACVLLVHHTTRGTDHGRGSTAIEGGVQTELVMTPGKKGTVKLKTEKQKDIDEPEPVELHAVAVEGTTSIVLDTADLGVDPLDLPAPERVNASSPIHERLARAIFEAFNHGTTGCTKAEARAAMQADNDLKIVGDSRAVGRRFPQAWSTLEGANRLEMQDSPATGYPVAKYKITDAYAAELELGEL